MALDQTVIPDKILPSESRANGAVTLQDGLFVMGPDGYLRRLTGGVDGGLNVSSTAALSTGQETVAYLRAIAWGIARLCSMDIDDLMDVSAED